MKRILMISRTLNLTSKSNDEELFVIPIKEQLHTKGCYVDIVLAPKDMNEKETQWFNKTILPMTLKKQTSIIYY